MPSTAASMNAFDTVGLAISGDELESSPQPDKTSATEAARKLSFFIIVLININDIENKDRENHFYNANFI